MNPDNSILKKIILDYMEETKLMQIATTKNNKPWIATVWYAHDKDLNIYFISRKARRHSLEIKNNPNVAGAIVNPHKTLGVKTRGLQFEGVASEVSILELPKAFKIYSKRFPKATKFIKSAQDIIRNLTERRIYKIKPSLFVLFDEINFPNNPRQELKL